MASTTQKTLEDVVKILDKAGWSDRSIHIGGDNSGQVGQSLENCTLIVRNGSGGKQSELLADLHKQVSQLLEKLSPDQKEDAAMNLERALGAASSPKPNRRWYTVSAEGLMEAAGWAKGFGGKIADSLSNLGKSVWPDFQLPGKE